jgi:hypothetical protein
MEVMNVLNAGTLSRIKHVTVHTAVLEWRMAMSKKRILNSTVTSDTIYGLIGNVIEFGSHRYLIMDYNWSTHCYTIWRFQDMHDASKTTSQIPDYMLIGSKIVDDKWEKLKNGKI